MAKSYFLITEPARGTSVQVNIPADTDPEDTLRAYAQENYAPDLVDYDELIKHSPHERLDAYLSDATGDRIELIEVTREVLAAERQAHLKSVRDLVVELLKQGAIADKCDVEVRAHDSIETICLDFEDGTGWLLSVERAQ